MLSGRGGQQAPHGLKQVCCTTSPKPPSLTNLYNFHTRNGKQTSAGKFKVPANIHIGNIGLAPAYNSTGKLVRHPPVSGFQPACLMDRKLDGASQACRPGDWHAQPRAGRQPPTQRCHLYPPASLPAVDSVPPLVTGGNMDNRRVGKGATLYLPVEVAGAMLSMGDAHLAQVRRSFHILFFVPRAFCVCHVSCCLSRGDTHLMQVLPSEASSVRVLVYTYCGGRGGTPLGAH